MVMERYPDGAAGAFVFQKCTPRQRPDYVHFDLDPALGADSAKHPDILNADTGSGKGLTNACW